MKVSILIFGVCPHETLTTNMSAVGAALVFEGKSCGLRRAGASISTPACESGKVR